MQLRRRVAQGNSDDPKPESVAEHAPAARDRDTQMKGTKRRLVVLDHIRVAGKPARDSPRKSWKELWMAAAAAASAAHTARAARDLRTVAPLDSAGMPRPP